MRSYDAAEKAIAFAVAKGDRTRFYLALHSPSPEAVKLTAELRKYVREYYEQPKGDSGALRDYQTWADLEVFGFEAERLVSRASTLSKGGV